MLAPPPPPRSTPGAATRFYVGRSASGASRVWTVGERVALLPHQRRWSDAPLGWGGLTAGAVELAAAVLHDHAAVHVAPSTAALLVRDVLAELPAAGFVLAADDVRLWLDLADAGAAPAAAPGPGDAGARRPRPRRMLGRDVPPFREESPVPHHALELRPS